MDDVVFEVVEGGEAKDLQERGEAVFALWEGKSRELARGGDEEEERGRTDLRDRREGQGGCCPFCK